MPAALPTERLLARSASRALDRAVHGAHGGSRLSWPVPDTLSDRVLEAMLFASTGRKPGCRRKAEPDWAHVHRELRRPCVTLTLLWEEYRAAEPGAYQYSRWCELYREWESRLSPTMRQAHPAGERLFVDYAGQTVPVIDAKTGEITPAQIFVAVLGAHLRRSHRDPDPARLDR